MIHEEITELETTILDHNEAPFDIRRDIMFSLVSIMEQMVTGERKKGSETFDSFVGMIDKNFGKTMGWIANMFPMVRYIPGDPFGLMEVIKDTVRNRAFMVNTVRRARDAERNSIAKYYYEEMEKNLKNGKETTQTERQLCATIGNFFTAGIQSKTTTLCWALLYLSRNPQVQERMYKEIESVIGVRQLPTLEDRANLPFCEATLMEVLRVANVFPFGGPHQTNKDIFFRGYFIPKDTQVIANFSSVLHDSKVFPNPEEFNPSRFLDEYGTINKPDEYIPFALGKRICVGENFARSELSLILTSLVQRFEFLEPRNKELATGVFVSAAERSPLPFDVIAKHRYANYTEMDQDLYTYKE
ncbi:hypothetical protein ScPMuIL_002386 [Solemya velum]